MLELRPYQSAAIDAINAAEREGTRRPLVVHPTGTGKTVTFSHYAAQRADLGRTLVLVHRDELAQQAAAKLAMVAPELRTGVVQAAQNETGADVVIGSVPTLARDNRLAALLAHGPIETVIVDEAHHAPAPTWTKVLTTLGSFSPYGPMTVGFTATPERDGKPLGVWERVVSYMSIRQAIYGTGGKDGGYLVPIIGQAVNTSADFGNVRTTGGDLNGGDLGGELEASGAIEEMADAVVTYAADRKGVAFLPTVETSRRLADALRERGIAAELVHGNMATDERRAVLHRLKTGQTTWVTNCAVLTEGFDEPSISCILVGRPTKFHGLYIQMVGRGTRKHPGKANFLVLDVTGASERHDLVALVDLGLADESNSKRDPGEESEPRPCTVCGQAPCTDPAHRCQVCNRPLPLELFQTGQRRHDTCQAAATGRRDVFGTSRVRWLPVGDAYVLGAGTEVVVMAPVTEDTWRLASYEPGKVKLTVLHDQLPAEWAMGIGEDRSKAFTRLIERDARWLAQPVTNQQLSRLLREGLPEAALPRVRTRGDAADLITRIQGRRAVKRLASL